MIREMSRGSSEETEDNDLENDGIDQPEETMDWREQLRNILLSISPNAFERLTLRLLREPEFTQVEVTGKSNDHCIDGKGIIRLNGIMSFHMIFQCKRYKGSVTPSEIRDFRGAMQGRADKELFITTGTFSTKAKREATRDGTPALDLIDGNELIDKLKSLGLGVNEQCLQPVVVESLAHVAPRCHDGKRLSGRELPEHAQLLPLDPLQIRSHQQHGLVPLRGESLFQPRRMLHAARQDERRPSPVEHVCDIPHDQAVARLVSAEFVCQLGEVLLIDVVEAGLREARRHNARKQCLLASRTLPHLVTGRPALHESDSLQSVGTLRRSRQPIHLTDLHRAHGLLEA